MTKSQQKNVPDIGIELGAACMPSELASDRATAPGTNRGVSQQDVDILKQMAVSVLSESLFKKILEIN